MKTINVARVSTEEQKDANISLPAQEERIKTYCSKKDFDVIKTYSFEESAYKAKRDEFDVIMEHIQEASKKEKIAVCFDKVDRFSRGSVFDKRVGILYEMALADKIELHFVSDGQIINNQMSAVEKFQFGMSLGLAKYYSDAIGDNVRRAFEQKRRNGEWTGGVRLGYLNIHLDEEKRLRKDIIIDPERAHLIQKMFELYATGNYSTLTIRDLMSKEGLCSGTGKPLALSMVDHILNNTFYYGQMVAKGKSYQHKYQPLITKELFDKCQRIRKGWNKKPFQYASKPFVLRGLVRCDKCGCSMSPEIQKGKYIYYSCTNGKKDICSTKVYIPEKDLLKPVYELLEAFNSIPQEKIDQLVEGLKQSTEAKNVYHKSAIDSFQSEYKATQAKIGRLMDLLIDDSITKIDYDKRLKEFKEKQYQINIQLEEHTKADESYYITASTVFNLAKDALELFESSEVDEKRAILNYILQNYTVNEKTPCITMRSPFKELLSLTNQPIGLRVWEDVRTCIKEKP